MLKEQLGDLDEQFRRGEFGPLLAWLRQHIHEHGQRFCAGRLVEVVSGRSLSNEPLMSQLNGRFRPLYGIA